MHSLSALALGLSLASVTSARVANAPSEVQRRNAAPQSENTIWNLFGLLKKRASSATCYQDDYYYFVFNKTFGEDFCSLYMNYPNTTTTVVYTPVTTIYDTYTTQHIRTETSVTTIPASTATVTASPIAGRDAEPQITPAPRNADMSFNDVFAAFRNRVDNTSIGTNAMSASFSSACSCQTYGGPVVTFTSTASPRTYTLSAFYQDTTTTAVTTTAGTVTTTVAASNAAATSEVVSQEISTTTSSGPGAAPTAPGFQCPEDHNTTVSQLVGPERYDYLVLCDTDISDDDFYSVLSYSSYSQCAAACSIANQRFDLPVCQGFSYYATSNSAGFNCFLKSTAETTVAAVGVDSGVLQHIAVGVNATDPSGTNTESGPFAEQTTVDPVAASSSLAQILTGSSTSISVVTPKPQMPGTGLLVNAASDETRFSTYVSEGSTYSYATVFSTYWTSDGSWYFSYYTSYTQSWASATTVYASSETSTSISNSSSSGTDVQAGGPEGGYWQVTTTNYTYYYPGGYNVTQVIANETYAANGSEIGAATTTYYYSYATGGAGSGGGNQGGPSSVSAGIVTSATSWTSVYSTQVVVSGGGGGGAGGAGGQGSGALQTPAPSVITNTFGTAYSSGFVVSGQESGIGGASSTEASGAIVSSAAVISGGLIPVSSTVVSGGTGGVFQTGGSGAIVSSGAAFSPISSTLVSGGTGFSFQTGGSGSGPLFSPISSTIISGGTAFASQTGGSGAIPSSGAPFTPISSTIVSGATAGASSTAGAGFTNSNDNRSGTLSTSAPFSTAPTGIPSSGSPFTPIFSTGGSTGTGGASSTAGSGNGTSPTGTGSVPFSAPSGPRSGSLSTSAPSGTAPTAPIGTAPSSGAPPFSAPSGPRSGTLPPSGTAPVGITFTEEIPIGTAPFPYVPPYSSGTAPPFSAPSGPRSGTLPPSGSLSFPTGTAPGSSGFPPFSAPSGPRSGTLPPSGTAPPATGIIPSGSVPTPPGTAPFSAPSGPRSGSLPIPTGTSPPIFSTGTLPPFPTGTSPTTCVTNILGTTTMFTTVTEYGCYSQCIPGGFGGAYGGGISPLTFGPPVASKGAGSYGPGGQ